ncbi:unnamed protein product, partial [Polarella glacialis]
AGTDELEELKVEDPELELKLELELTARLAASASSSASAAELCAQAADGCQAAGLRGRVQTWRMLSEVLLPQDDAQPSPSELLAAALLPESPQRPLLKSASGARPDGLSSLWQGLGRAKEVAASSGSSRGALAAARG